MSDKSDNQRSWGRRKVVRALGALPLGIILASQLSWAAPATSTGQAVTDDTVTVGILHSLTGTMAISETGAQEAEKLAIKQINESGGILGRQIKIIQEDGASDWPTFAEKSRKL
jgi:urea transport system substrate-binding protein